MRIAVDATSLLDVRTGVGNFTDAVVRRLGQRPDIDTTIFPISLRGHHRLRDTAPPGVDVVTPPLPARLLRRSWLATGRPRIDRFIGPHDLVYGPNFVVPPSRSARVVTVHDLTAIRFPELCTADTLQYPRLLERAIGDGAWIHTVSDAVRREVIADLGADADRVVAVPNGHRSADGGDAGVGRRLAGRDTYALAVGTVEPRKGLPGLLEAIDLLAADGQEIPLVHVGPDGWGSAALDATLAAMRRPDLFVRLGRRSDDELDDLFAGARVFVYPSVYEGFGLPVVEAMSAGLPVVTSDDPAVVEVAGGAAVHTPVGDVAALAAGIARAWDDEALRTRLVAEGRRRADEFSWDRCTDGLVDVFHAAVADGGSA
ncbi:glycosyltransferase family 4 protein [Actinospongicola halichondriae]|uniref:glycosyltransferase family 4 protein n=1 Tax=Actinospongicola halichondriae TaxID=3236844 RepID=UPI003D552B46